MDFVILLASGANLNNFILDLVYLSLVGFLYSCCTFQLKYTCACLKNSYNDKKLNYCSPFLDVEEFPMFSDFHCNCAILFD
jgi:hypothetical protein